LSANSKEELVMPGKFLTTEEEFLPGSNTFDDKEGNVYASSMGKVEFDNAKKEVKVNTKTRTVKPIDVGSIVVGKVSMVKEQVIFIDILEAYNNGEPRAITNSFGTLHVASASMGYVNKMSELFRAGDIVKARVVEVNPYSISLTTKESFLGVMKAFCVKCRKPLGLFGTSLKCTACGNAETRKLSMDYVLK
jgi:exosome complex component CSL4